MARKRRGPGGEGGVPMAGQLTGKVALVTGGGSGIGRATALAAAREGARLVVADADPAGGEETVGAVRAAGGEALFVRADVSVAAEAGALVGRTVAVYGRLDCAHNNAGVEGPRAPLHAYAEAAWDRVMAVNLKGTWLCMQHEIRQMLEQGGGAVVNTASVAGLIGSSSGICAYNASKHGIVGLTRTAALEYAKSGVRVNAVCPGLVATPMTDRLFGGDAALAARFAAALPTGRSAAPEEVAAAVVWLCSDAASYVTGVAMPVDGGYLVQ
jgi:NAD(P)-dependent dehydrogenase (short-subunit alcohol dehydrogenase family)